MAGHRAQAPTRAPRIKQIESCTCGPFPAPARRRWPVPQERVCASGDESVRRNSPRASASPTSLVTAPIRGIAGRCRRSHVPTKPLAPLTRSRGGGGCTPHGHNRSITACKVEPNTAPVRDVPWYGTMSRNPYARVVVKLQPSRSTVSLCLRHFSQMHMRYRPS